MIIDQLVESYKKFIVLFITSFYQLVLEPELTFHAHHGLMTEGPVAMFASLPESPLLTLSMEVPHAWFVEPVQSVYDLDNIHLAGVSLCVHSIYHDCMY